MRTWPCARRSTRFRDFSRAVEAQTLPFPPHLACYPPFRPQRVLPRPRPLPPHPTQQQQVQQQSPRASPPKMPAQARQQRQSVDSPIGPPAPQGSYYQQPRKDKESSPFRPVEPQTRAKAGNGGKGKNPATYVSCASRVLVRF